MSDKRAVDDHFAHGDSLETLLAATVPYDEWEASLQPDPGKENDPGLIKMLADEIGAGAHFAQDTAKRLHVFREGAYRAEGDEAVKRQVKALVEQWGATDDWTPSLAENVIEYLRVDAPGLWERPPLDVVNVRNGLLDLSTRALRPHDPSYLSSLQLPVIYDPAATCPAWDQFVAQVFPPDAVGLAYEIPAQLMRPDTSIQKAVLLLGEGGNGKSTYLAGLTQFLGRANIAAVSLHRLESDRFAVARLLGRLANIAADLPSEHLAGTDMFKNLTGGDVVSGEFKYKDAFDFEPFARLVFSANHPPRSADASQAFFDRWVVVPFVGRFRGEATEIPRKVLDARLADPQELSGLLNRALEALVGLEARGKFMESESLRQAREEFRDSTDPLVVWLDRATLLHPTALVVKADLYQAYVADVERRGIVPQTAKMFGSALKRWRPDLEEKQRTVRGRLQWVWLGIGLRGADEPDPPASPSSRHSRDSFIVTSTRVADDDTEGEDEEQASARGTTIVESREWREPSEVNPCLPFEEGVL